VLIEAAFAEAFIHRWPRRFDARDPWSGHRVLGKRLRPFSIWHALLLTREASPFTMGGGVARVAPGDLVKAVAVCQMRFPWSGPDGQIQPRFSWRTFWRMLGGGFAMEVEAFQAYLADFQTLPEYTVIPPRNAGESRTPAPETLRLVRAVIGCTGCSRQEAWDCPLGEARWWFALWLQERGADLDFTSAGVRAEQEQLEQENPELHAALVRGAARIRNAGTH
jgi:hypothetical protein